MATKSAAPILVPVTPEMRALVEQRAALLDRSLAWVVREALAAHFAL